MGYQTAANRQRLRALQDGLRANVDTLLNRRAADAIADTQRHFENDEHLSPEQVVEYRRRLDAYGRTGKPPMQREIDLYPEGPACA